MQLKGIYPIVPTPFLDQGEIDYPSIERLVEFMAQKKDTRWPCNAEWIPPPGTVQ